MLRWPLLVAVAAAVPCAAIAQTPPDAGAPSPLAAPLIDAPPPAPEPGGRTWNLEEVLEQAAQRQPDLRDARLRAEENRADAVAAGLRPNPQLQLGLSNIPLQKPQGARAADVLVWGAGLSEDIELGGKRGKRMASAEAGVEAGQAAVRDVQRTSNFDIRKAFLQALAAEEHQQLAATSLARYLDSVKLIRARFEAGEDAGADVNKIELEKRRYAQEARESARAAVEARAELFRLTGLPGSAEKDRVTGRFPPPPAIRGELEPLVQRALRDRADLAALQAQLQKAKADLELAHAQAIPDVNLGVAYAYSPTEIPSGATSTLGATATIALPVFNRNQGEIQKAELEVSRAELALERARADAEREVRLAMGHLNAASEAVDELDKNYLARADTALRIAERSYREGKASLLEVLEAQRTFLETRSDYLDATVERSLGLLELERAVGGVITP